MLTCLCGFLLGLRTFNQPYLSVGSYGLPYFFINLPGMEFLEKLIRKENMSSAWLPVLMKREEALLLIVWGFCFVGLILVFCCFVDLIVFVCFGFFNMKLASIDSHFCCLKSALLSQGIGEYPLVPQSR